ncbi:MAG TPA: class I SAM-dependent methyltransferase [Spirochaetia bacterium]|nr:class I SAM-dependent methyltransferase [Spirochaetia bacterium]
MEKNNNASLVDLGCDDGKWTKKLAKKIKTKRICGVEVVSERIALAVKKGVKVFKCDLNKKLDISSNSFEVVHSNQVIEHLNDTDMFIDEIFRILIPGGYAVISTENLSSWHNVFALFFGFQPFSMTNFSSLGNIGNPFALWNGKINKNSSMKSWQHQRLFSYYGIIDILKKHGFIVENIKTSGYYPLPGFISKIDRVHGHWIVIKIRKPKLKK